MCRAFRLFIALAVVLATSGSLAAQGGTSARIREQERLVDSLVAKSRQARAALQAFDDSVSRVQIRMDTLRIGSLQFKIEPAVRERAERAARIASARVDSIAGTGARRFGGAWLVVRATGGTSLDTLLVNYVQPRNEGLSRREIPQVWGFATDSTLADWMYRTALRVLGENIDPAALAWQTGVVRPDTVRTSEWVATRLEVVSSPTTVARRCYGGDLPACRVALGLVPTADWVTEWFDAKDRRRYVNFYQRRRQRGGLDTDLCLEGSDAACIAVMHGIRFYAEPVPPHHRMTLVRTAIRIGGTAGFERYLTATGSQAERLGAIAGAPPDSVLRVWMRNVHDARLPSSDMSTGIAMSSLGWILVCGVLALRSSRWR